MEFKRSVCCISDGKITAKCAKIANKKRECPLEFFRPSTESLLDLRRESPSSLSVKKNGESAINLTAKVLLICFSLFASFALFAVQVSKPECPLEFSPRNARKSRTKKGVFPGDLKRLKVESKKRFTLPQEREPRAVKEEEALVRTVRVVRGSGF